MESNNAAWGETRQDEVRQRGACRVLMVGDGDVEANCDVVSISFYPRVPAADE